MFRYFIYLSFDGTNYHGWQIQPNGASVQETLMKALSTFLRREIEVVGAGRTDAGVHARLMVAHFDFDTELDGEVVTDKLNRLLPPDIAVYGVRRVKPKAHARFDATSRTYKYYIHTRKDPFRRGYSWVFTIRADRFLRNMVRAVVGTLVEVGRGKLTVDGFRRVIEEKNRCSAGTSVPGHALYLTDVSYPDDLFL